MILGIRVFKILGTHFRETTSPGLLVYEEFIVADKPLDRNARREVTQEVERGHSVMSALLPAKEFYELLAAVEDSCAVDGNPGLVTEFLTNLEQTCTGIGEATAIERLPGNAFGGAFAKGDRFTTNASEASKALSESELHLVSAQVQLFGDKLRNRPELAERFSHALGGKA